MDKLVVLLLTIPATILLTLFYDKAIRLKMGVRYYDPSNYKALTVEWFLRELDNNEWNISPLNLANRLKRFYISVSIIVIALVIFLNLRIVEETTMAIGVVRAIFNAIILANFLKSFVRWKNVHKWLANDLKVDNVPDKKTWKLLYINSISIFIIILFIVSPFTGALGYLSFNFTIAGEYSGVGFVNSRWYHLIWDKPTSFAFWMVFDLILFALLIGFAITFRQLWTMNREREDLKKAFIYLVTLTWIAAYSNLVIMLISWSIYHGANADDLHTIFKTLNVSNISLSISVAVVAFLLISVKRKLNTTLKTST